MAFPCKNDICQKARSSIFEQLQFARAPNSGSTSVKPEFVQLERVKSESVRLLAPVFFTNLNAGPGESTQAQLILKYQTTNQNIFNTQFREKTEEKRHLHKQTVTDLE